MFGLSTFKILVVQLIVSMCPVSLQTSFIMSERDRFHIRSVMEDNYSERWSLIVGVETQFQINANAALYQLDIQIGIFLLICS